MARNSIADSLDLDEQRVWLWFEFYKLALADTRYREATRESRDYYVGWGRVRPTDKFKKWWKTHFAIFGIGVMEDKRQPIDEWLFVAIPLNQSEQKIVSQLRPLIQKRQAKLVSAQRSSRHSKSGRKMGIPFGLYDLTEGTEFRVGPSMIALTIYQHFIAGRRARPKINPAFLKRVQRFYLRRGAQPPGPISADPEGPQMFSALRALRRYVYRAEALVAAAAIGEFPGENLPIARG